MDHIDRALYGLGKKGDQSLKLTLNGATRHVRQERAGRKLGREGQKQTHPAVDIALSLDRSTVIGRHQSQCLFRNRERSSKVFGFP
jgi:hypothetical protein